MAEQQDASDDTYNISVESELKLMEGRLNAEGKSPATVNKYLRDLRCYFRFAGQTAAEADSYCDWDILHSYRDYLAVNYKLSSANSMIASVNSYLRGSGREDLTLKGFRCQRELFRSDEHDLSKEEYVKLLEAARAEGNERMCLIMQTLGSTGMRVSELPFITVESLEHRRARVSLKGKSRTVILPAKLCSHLADYVKSKGISSGSVFVTRSGRPVDRSNILHDMKRLSVKAGVDPGKAFPHNLRHLFAVTYYRSERDLMHLADILGHSNINTTRIYTQIGESQIAATIEGLGLL